MKSKYNYGIVVGIQLNNLISILYDPPPSQNSSPQNRFLGGKVILWTKSNAQTTQDNYYYFISQYKLIYSLRSLIYYESFINSNALW